MGKMRRPHAGAAVAMLGFTWALAVWAQAEPVVRSAQRQRDGVFLSLTDGWLRLQVCDEDTLRVLFSPTRAGLHRRSLAVVADWRPVRWSLRQTPDAIEVATARLQARVERATGTVRFFDSGGRVVLGEPREQARVLEPARVAGEDTYHATQRFVVAPGEALYGLGQHANGAMNQRGQVVMLRQVNMDVGVPVLVSSRGYGVLWDNPSLTVVNCGAPEATLIPAERLFDVEGRPGALTGMYFDGTAFETLRGTRRDAGIDFDWPGSPVEGVGADRFCVRWVGEVEAGPPGEYVFVTQADDGVRLWVDDKLIIDDWTVHPPKTLYGRIRLEGGRRYPIKMEFYENTGGAVARLRWAPPRPGAEETCSWWSEVADAIDYYFLYGPELDAVIAAYRRATGAAPIFPRWAWGFWQCRERYQTQAELLGVLEEYRRRGTPRDGIIQDWFSSAPAPWESHQFSPASVVCPVVERGATKRRVYLPRGVRWYDFWTGRAYDGGAVIEAEAPLERLPIFVRAGAILPMGPVIQWDGEKPCDPVEVRVYPGADGSFVLYEDQGDGYDYERGAYATILMSCQEKARQLMIGERRGTFPGMLQKRRFRVVVVSPGRGTGIEAAGRADAEVRYEGKSLSLRL